MLPIKESDLNNAYKDAVERLLGKCRRDKRYVKGKTIEDEILTERETDLIAVQQAIEVAQQNILELFQRRRKNEITINEYEREYATISTKVIELQQQEEKLKENKVNNQIAKQRTDEIKRVLQDDRVDYMDVTIMRMLIVNIIVVDKNEIEFKF